jgi:alpha-1,2-mannosyltransferase
MNREHARYVMSSLAEDRSNEVAPVPGIMVNSDVPLMAAAVTASHSGRPWLRGLALGAATAGLSLVLLWMSWQLRRQTDFLDMRIYRNATRYWLQGHGLYTFQQPGTRNHLGFTYPPFGALILLPLAALSEQQAQWTLAALNVAICAACGSGYGIALARRFGWSLPASAVLATAAVLSLEPIRESLGFGQINIVLLGLVSLDIWLLSTGRRGGYAIGVAAAIKLTPAVLILALFAARRGDAGRRAVLGALAATAGAAAVAPGASWRYWTQQVWETSRVGEPGRVANQAWSGVLARALEVAHPPTLAWALGAAAAVGAALLFARRAARWWPIARVIAVAAAASTAASPISWTHHFWWAVPALAALAYRAAETRTATAVAVFAAVYALFAIGPLRLEQTLHHRLWLGHAASELYLYATVLACAALMANGARTAARIMRADSHAKAPPGTPQHACPGCAGRSAGSDEGHWTGLLRAHIWIGPRLARCVHNS